MIDVNDLKGLLELANDYVDDGLHFLTEPVSYGELKLLAERLISAEKDAARYRWIKDNGQLGVGRCGVDWELYFEGPAPDNSAKVERHIDEAMQCTK